MLQTILGLTASEFASDSSNTAAVTAAIVSSFQAPANISAGQVRGLLLLDAHAAADRGQKKKLKQEQEEEEEEEFVGSWALVAISYDIVTESRYPSEAFSSQLRRAVASGAFSRSLQLFAARLGATHLRNATSPAVSVGKPEQGKGKERKGSSPLLFSFPLFTSTHTHTSLAPSSR